MVPPARKRSALLGWPGVRVTEPVTTTSLDSPLPFAPAISTARSPGVGFRVLRIVVGLVYTFGSASHVYFALGNPDAYADFSKWAPPLSEPARDLWGWFLDHASTLALGIALFEIVVGVAILAGGKATKLGLAAALAFHLALTVLFGMWPYTLPMLGLLALSLRYDYAPAWRHFRRGA